MILPKQEHDLASFPQVPSKLIIMLVCPLKLLFYSCLFEDQGLPILPVSNDCILYVYRETWEKVNLRVNDNHTITFNQRKTFQFSRELSVGDEEDMVVVPNIPMLVKTIYYLYNTAQIYTFPDLLTICISFTG